MARARAKTGREELRFVATLEALKGVVVLLAGCGALALIHKNLHHVAVELVKVLHLNPARHYPRIFIDAANRLTDPQLWALALSALVYSAARLVEAYGLWREKRWAEWFGLLSGGIYLPVELYEMWRAPTWPRITVFIVNLVVVVLLASAMWGKSRRRYPR